MAALFGLIDISDSCMTSLLACAQKLSTIKISILFSAISLIEQVLTKPVVYSESVKVGLKLIEQILKQNNGYRLLQKHQIVRKLLKYGEQTLLSQEIINVLQEKGWDTSNLLSDSEISVTLSINDE